MTRKDIVLKILKERAWEKFTSREIATLLENKGVSVNLSNLTQHILKPLFEEGKILREDNPNGKWYVWYVEIDIIDNGKLRYLLKNFIQEIRTGDFYTDNYVWFYRWLKLSAFLGKWVNKWRTWIAFFWKWQEINKWIYPIILFDFSTNTVKVVYWKSYNNLPELDWPEEIKNNKMKVEYKNKEIWYLQKEIDGLDETISDVQLDKIINSLDKVIDVYLSVLKCRDYKLNQSFASLKNIFNWLESNLIIDNDFLYNILISIATTNFIIFSWPSGVGKSKLVSDLTKKFTNLDENTDNIKDFFVKKPVKANWFDESAIIGFWNSLLKKYEFAEVTEVLNLLFSAYRCNDCFFFLLFDEMNLARIENYFNEFLIRIDEVKEKEEAFYRLFSTYIDRKTTYDNINYMLRTLNINESLKEDLIENDELRLFFQDDIEIIENDREIANDEINFEKETWRLRKWTDYVSSNFVFRLIFKDNLKVFWTINEDETVVSIPTKVLDRCQYIQFEINLENDGENLVLDKDITFYELLVLWNRLNKHENINDFFEILKNERNEIEWIDEVEVLNLENIDFVLTNSNNKQITIFKFLVDLNKQIKEIDYNLQIWYRTIKEIAIYTLLYLYGLSEYSEEDVKNAIDWQIKQKILPKLKSILSMAEDNSNTERAINEIENLLKKYDLRKSLNYFRSLKVS